MDKIITLGNLCNTTLEHENNRGTITIVTTEVMNTPDPGRAEWLGNTRKVVNSFALQIFRLSQKINKQLQFPGNSAKIKE